MTSVTSVSLPSTLFTRFAGLQARDRSAALLGIGEAFAKSRKDTAEFVRQDRWSSGSKVKVAVVRVSVRRSDTNAKLIDALQVRAAKTAPRASLSSYLTAALDWWLNR